MQIELPRALEDWQVKPVGEVFEINGETLPSSTAPDFHFRYITLESVCPERIDYDSVDQIRFAEAPSRARRVIRRGDILVSTVRPNLQGFAEFQPPDEGPYVCSTGFAVLTPKNGHDQQFYLQQLLSDFGASQFHAYVTGTNYPAISDRDFSRIKLLVPSDVLEHKAALALRNLACAITAARESIAKAERLQKGLMQQLLTGRLKADGTLRNRHEFEETKIGLLPKDWTLARVKEFGDVSTGKTPPTDNEVNFGGDYPFITPGDVGESKWIRKSERSLSALGSGHSGVLPANAVCVVCIGATIGKIGLTVRPSCSNQQLNAVVCSEEHFPEYLYYALRHRSRHLLAIAGVNATPQLNKSDFSKYRLPMPADWNEEVAIAKNLAVFDDMIEAKKTKIIALQTLKKSLMQNLLTGRTHLSVNLVNKKDNN